jgi:NIPSNAP
MIFLHETHDIAGGKSCDFETALREQWQPLIEPGGRARLLWYWSLTHGTGISYQAVSITAIRDWAAWGEIVAAMRTAPEWRRWFETCWALRREVTSKMLQPTRWSPLQRVDLDSAAIPDNSEPSLYLHDTGWPYVGKLDAYTEALGTVFYPATRKYRMIRVEACWTVCPGTGRHHEVVLLQKILDWPAFSHLLTQGERPSRPGEWMEEGLKYRDRWESKLLRPAAWSPRR